MADEFNRVELKLPRDARLAVAIGGAAAHFAERAGLDARAQADLVSAAEEAGRQTLLLLSLKDDPLGVVVQDFPDRVEITLEHHGQAVPTAGLDTYAVPGAEESGPGGLSGLRLLERVDRVLYITEGGTSRFTLVKYIHGKPANK